MKQGWESKKLGDVYDVRDGTHDSPKYQDSGFPLVTSKNLKDGSITLDKIKYISKIDYLNINKRSKVDIGDILFAMIGTIGNPVVVMKEPDFAIKNVALFKVPEEQSIAFLKYYLEFVTETMKGDAKGSTQKFVGLGYLRGFEIHLPELQEQKQIVAKLDQCFEAIDKAKANTAKNLENAKELFQSKLNDIFSQKGEGWVEKKLGQITTKIGSGATPRGGQSSYKESGISLIRSLNVYDDGFKERKLAFIDDSQAEKLNNVTIEVGDVLLNITGASVARCCIAPNDFLPARVNQHVSIIRLKQDTLSAEFLHYLLISKVNKDLLLGIGEQGATRQAITKVQIQNFIVSYPEDKKEQEHSVNLIDKLKEQTQSLESKYQQELNSLEELKKSILQKAFEGEL